MSNRTAQANRAVQEAWDRELELVKQGKGTRDWTPEQQNDILTRGKAYDENGKAFQGHHMMSVEAYPEYQGDQENIQFLSPEEHLKAHNGNFQNPTHWYYDPVYDEQIVFTGDTYQPCEVIRLSEPDVNVKDDLEGDSITDVENEDSSTETDAEIGYSNNDRYDYMMGPMKPISIIEDDTPGILERIGEWNRNFPYEHPIATKWIKRTVKVAKGVGIILIAKTAKNVADNLLSGGHRSERSHHEYSDNDTVHDDQDDEFDFDETSEQEESVDPVERSSPDEHIVKGHGQHYWKNGERIWKEKEPYQRGGKKDSDEETSED